MSTGEEAVTQRAPENVSAAERGGGIGWWLSGTIVIAVIAFFPVPWQWPPADLLTLLPTSNEWPALAALLVGFCGFVVVRRWILPTGRGQNTRVSWCFAFLVLQALLLRGAIEARPFVIVNTKLAMPEPVLAFPWIIPVGLATVLFGVRHGFVVAAATTGLAWLMADSGATPLLGTGLALGGFVGALSLRRCPLRWHVIRGCLRAGATFGAIAMIAALLRTREWDEVLVAVAYPVVTLSAAGLVLLTLLPFAEWLTSSLSDITLIEYASDHRLLDKLRAEAPGTWNHSINVADLAESAARAIGANALFCRTASLFHDIGKTTAPEIFAENQRGTSPHDKLSPLESATRIIAHVTNGLEIASRHRLPRPFRNIIAEHHGTSLVRFFYARAVEKIQDPAEREKLRESFRYPGPPPSSRESGIIALADTIEAAARSMQDPDEERIKNLVQGLIADRIKESEFRDCPLTLAELVKVEETFITMLTSRYHKRPAYPKAGGTVPSAAGAAAAADDGAAAIRTPAVKKLRSRQSKR